MQIPFEVQATSEVWRRPYCTFTVLYPSKKQVAIMALRGKFTRQDYKAICNHFFDQGYEKILLEREINGVLVERPITLAKRYTGIEPHTFKREK